MGDMPLGQAPAPSTAPTVHSEQMCVPSMRPLPSARSVTTQDGQRAGEYDTLLALPTGTAQYHVFRNWLKEGIAVMMAVGIVVAIALVLRRFQDQPVPDWGPSINLSTLLALLSTLFRAFVLFATSQIISQRKWDLYGDRAVSAARPLQHLQDYDAGSRSAWGAARLIKTVLGPGRDAVAAVAVLLTLVSLAVGPFVQQAIKTTACATMVEGAASIPYAHYVPRAGGFIIDYTDYSGSADAATKVMVFSSLTSPSGPDSRLKPSCATGNCTFPAGDPLQDDETASSFSTVGMCHICQDITGMITYGDQMSFRFDVAGLLVASGGGYATPLTSVTTSNLTWIGASADPELLHRARWAYANVSVITLTSEGCVEQKSESGSHYSCSNVTTSRNTSRRLQNNARAATCALYPCMRTYTAAVQDGELAENLVSTEPLQPDMLSVQNNPNVLQSDHRYTSPTSYSAMDNNDWHYTAIKSPCRTEAGIFRTDHGAKAILAGSTTSVALCRPGTDGSCRFQNVSAPERCIYRHNARHASSMSKLLARLLVGGCNVTPQTGEMSCNFNEQSGLGRFLELLYHNGTATFKSMDMFFGDFTTALTNRFRSSLGGAVFDASKLSRTGKVVEWETFPVGEAHGVAWQTTVCNSMQWQWLLLPAILSGLTGGLLVWTVSTSWRLRGLQPVWKDSILPLLLYRDRFESEAIVSVQSHPLLETGEMEKLAGASMTRFQLVQEGKPPQ